MDCIFYFVIFKCELILTFFKISLFLAIGEFWLMEHKRMLKNIYKQ